MKTSLTKNTFLQCERGKSGVTQAYRGPEYISILVFDSLLKRNSELEVAPIKEMHLSIIVTGHIWELVHAITTWAPSLYRSVLLDSRKVPCVREIWKHWHPSNSQVCYSRIKKAKPIDSNVVNIMWTPTLLVHDTSRDYILIISRKISMLVAAGN